MGVRGRPLSPEHRAAISAARKGQRLSEEQLAKVRAAAKARRRPREQCRANEPDGTRCVHTARTRRLCPKHYRKWWLYGDPEAPSRRPAGRKPQKSGRKTPAKPKPLELLEAAWLAGLFEGEGTIIIGGRHGWSVSLVIGMADRDIIERVNQLVPMPNGPHFRARREPQHKDHYVWSTGRAETVTMMLRTLLPWFGERRRARALEALDVLAVQAEARAAARKRTHCSKGHPLDEENTIALANGRRQCKRCRRQGQRRWEQRQRAATAATA